VRTKLELKTRSLATAEIARDADYVDYKFSKVTVHLAKKRHSSSPSVRLRQIIYRCTGVPEAIWKWGSTNSAPITRWGRLVLSDVYIGDFGFYNWNYTDVQS